jgi:hypothetical protein
MVIRVAVSQPPNHQKIPILLKFGMRPGMCQLLSVAFVLQGNKIPTHSCQRRQVTVEPGKVVWMLSSNSFDE